MDSADLHGQLNPVEDGFFGALRDHTGVTRLISSVGGGRSSRKDVRSFIPAFFCRDY